MYGAVLLLTPMLLIRSTQSLVIPIDKLATHESFKPIEQEVPDSLLSLPNLPKRSANKHFSSDEAGPVEEIQFNTLTLPTTSGGQKDPRSNAKPSARTYNPERKTLNYPEGPVREVPGGPFISLPSRRRSAHDKLLKDVQNIPVVHEVSEPFINLPDLSPPTVRKRSELAQKHNKVSSTSTEGASVMEDPALIMSLPVIDPSFDRRRSAPAKLPEGFQHKPVELEVPASFIDLPDLSPPTIRKKSELEDSASASDGDQDSKTTDSFPTVP